MNNFDVLSKSTKTFAQAVSDTVSAFDTASQLFLDEKLDLNDANILCRKSEVVPGEPYKAARSFEAAFRGAYGVTPLVACHKSGKMMTIFRGRYVEVTMMQLRALLEGWFRLPAVYERAGERKLQAPVYAKAKFAKDVIEQIKLICAFDDPSGGGLVWREQLEGEPDVGDLIVTANGIVDTRSATLLPHTPRLFATSASDVVFDPNAGKPEKTIAFLNQIFGGDQEQVDTFFEFMGETLAGTNKTQKALLIKGVPRSGKSTCMKLIKAILPENKSVSKRVDQLGKNFGHQSLIGKQFCVFEDIRHISQRGMECMLSLMAGDANSVEVKYQNDYVGHLNVKCALATNIRLNMDTSSEAFLSRLVTLETVESHADNMDTGLLDRLLEERPQILLEAVKGYQRLQERGGYKQPENSKFVQDDVSETTHNIAEFVEDCVEVGDDFFEDRTAIYEAYKIWAPRECYGLKEAQELWNGVLDTCPAAKRLGQKRVQDPSATNLRIRPIRGLRLNLETLLEISDRRRYRYSSVEGSQGLARTRPEILGSTDN